MQIDRNEVAFSIFLFKKKLLTASRMMYCYLNWDIMELRVLHWTGASLIYLGEGNLLYVVFLNPTRRSLALEFSRDQYLDHYCFWSLSMTYQMRPHFFRYTLFADDSTLTAKFSRNDTNISNSLNAELESVKVWLQANRIAANSVKTKYIHFSATPR